MASFQLPSLCPSLLPPPAPQGLLAASKASTSSQGQQCQHLNFAFLPSTKSLMLSRFRPSQTNYTKGLVTKQQGSKGYIFCFFFFKKEGEKKASTLFNFEIMNVAKTLTRFCFPRALSQKTRSHGARDRTGGGGLKGNRTE